MQGNKVLIVDDDPNIREVISVLLSSEGYDVDAAENGQMAIDKVYAGNEYDIICLDIMMPEMDGIEVCSRIREKSKVPVLFLTAKSQDKDKVEAYSMGGDDFLVKPFSQTELLMKIEALIRRHKEYDKPAGTGDGDDARLSDDIVVDTRKRSVLKDGVRISLTDKEFDILR